MGIPAKPVTPSFQSGLDTSAHARLFACLTETSLPCVDLISSTNSTTLFSGTAPAFGTGTFAGTAGTELVTFINNGQALEFVGRGNNINTQTSVYCCNSWVAFRQTESSVTNGGIQQVLTDFSGVFDMALATDGTNALTLYGNGSASPMTKPGLILTINHDYLLYWGYTWDNVNTCTAYWCLYDYTAAAYVTPTNGAFTQVGSTNVYSHSGAQFSADQLVTAASRPCNYCLGGGSNAIFTFIGQIYGSFFAESTSASDLWTQTQITELVASPLRSAQAPAPSVTFSGGLTGLVGSASAAITATLQSALGGSGGTLALSSTDGSAVFTPSSLGYSSVATTATFTYTAAVSGNATITGSGSGISTSTGGFVATPTAPTSVTATPGNALISVAWTSGLGSTGDKIYASTSSGTETLLASGVTSPYVDSPLTLSTHKYYYVKSGGLNSTLSAASSEVNGTVTVYNILTFLDDISLGMGNTGLTLNAQLYDSTFVSTGTPITTGFNEVASSPGNTNLPGTYWLKTTIAAGFQGFIVYYAAGSPGTWLEFKAINTTSGGGGGGGGGGGFYGIY